LSLNADDDNDDNDDSDLFLSSVWKGGDIIYIIINIMINRIIGNSCLEKINTPIVITVIVIAVIDSAYAMLATWQRQLQ
jgi:hypothetical protein